MATNPGSTVAALANLLQNKYIPGLIRQFNDRFPNLRYIRQNSTDLTAEGTQAVIAIETGLNEAGGVHGESADVASAVSPTVRQITVKLKQMTFRARISWKLMKKARTQANAFARGLDLTLRSTRDAFVLTANTYTWGDGSGVVARVKTTDGAGNLTLDRVYGKTGQPFMVIRPNQTLHMLDKKGFGGAADHGSFSVTSVDWEADLTVITCVVAAIGASNVANIVQNDYVYLQNSITGFSDTNETDDNTPPMGFAGFYDSTAVDPLQGLAVATEPMWKPHIRPAATRATIISDMNKAREAALKRDPEGSIAYIVSSYESRQRWYDELVEKAEWRNIQKLDGAFDVAVYAGKPWFADHTAPDQTVYFVPRGYIQRYSASEFVEVINDDNSVLHQVPNKVVFDALFSALYEFGINRRNGLVSLPGLSW